MGIERERENLRERSRGKATAELRVRQEMMLGLCSAKRFRGLRAFFLLESVFTPPASPGSPHTKVAVWTTMPKGQPERRRKRRSRPTVNSYNGNLLGGFLLNHTLFWGHIFCPCVCFLFSFPLISLTFFFFFFVFPSSAFNPNPPLCDGKWQPERLASPLSTWGSKNYRHWFGVDLSPKTLFEPKSLPWMAPVSEAVLPARLALHPLPDSWTTACCLREALSILEKLPGPFQARSCHTTALTSQLFPSPCPQAMPTSSKGQGSKLHLRWHTRTSVATSVWSQLSSILSTCIRTPNLFLPTSTIFPMVWHHGLTPTRWTNVPANHPCTAHYLCSTSRVLEKSTAHVHCRRRWTPRSALVPLGHHVVNGNEVAFVSSSSLRTWSLTGSKDTRSQRLESKIGPGSPRTPPKHSSLPSYSSHL